MDLLKLIQDYGVATIALAGFAYGIFQVGRAVVNRVVRIINNDEIQKGTHVPSASGLHVTVRRDPDGFRRDRQEDRPSLKMHFFFTTVNQLVSEEIEQIDCGCPARTMLFQDMCRTMAIQWREFLTSVLDDEGSGLHAAIRANRSTAEGYNLGRDVLASFQRWRADMEADWRRGGIPEVAIRSFSEWIKPRLDKLRDTTGSIASSAYFSDNAHRLACILAVHEVALRLIVLDMNSVIYSLNGKLDGHLYRNVRIIAIRDLVIARIEIENARHVAEENFRQRAGMDGFSSSRPSIPTPIPGSIVVPPTEQK
jgi:hypothetical protein